MNRGKAVYVLIFCLAVHRVSSQLVLDDIADEFEETVDNVAKSEPTDPYTRMLQWGVDNMDRASVAEQAEAIREGRMKPKKIDKEVMDLIFGSKINFLQKAVDELNKAHKSNIEDDLVAALEQLEEQITDIDNAGDLDTLGGLRPTLDLLVHASGRVRQAAFWVVGSTVQSNPKMQDLVFSLGALPTILAPIQAAADASPAAAAAAAAAADLHVLAKNLYALSALLRGCGPCLADFAGRGGGAALAALLARLPPGAAWLPVRRKAAALVGDLVQEEGDAPAAALLAAEFAPAPAAGGAGGAGGTPALLALLPLLRSGDRELQEKTLDALLALLRAAPAAAAALWSAGAAGELRALKERALAEMGAARRAASAEGGAEPGEDGDGAGGWDVVLQLSEAVLQALPNATAGGAL